MKAKITIEHSQKIEALISQKVFTLQDIISLLDNIYTEHQIRYHINKYYSQYKHNLVKEYSKGGTKLEYLLKQIFPANKIIKEFPLGKRLRVDFVIEEPYNLAFEYDGSQHNEYVPFFHNDKQGFEDSKQRDSDKELLLRNRGLNLIRIDNLEIDLSFLKSLIEEVGYGTGVVHDKNLLTFQEKSKEHRQSLLQASKARTQQLQEQKKKLSKVSRKKVKSFYENSYSTLMKEKQKAFRKEQYQKQKAWLKEQKQASQQ